MTWGAGSWLMQVTEAKSLSTAELEVAKRTVGVPRRPGELWLPYFQRRMRLARAVLHRFCGAPIADLCWRTHWRWAGHLDRYPDDYFPQVAEAWLCYSDFMLLRAQLGIKKLDRSRVWRWEQPVVDLLPRRPDCILLREQGFSPQ